MVAVRGAGGKRWRSPGCRRLQQPRQGGTCFAALRVSSTHTASNSPPITLMESACSYQSPTSKKIVVGSWNRRSRPAAQRKNTPATSKGAPTSNKLTTRTSMNVGTGKPAPPMTATQWSQFSNLSTSSAKKCTERTIRDTAWKTRRGVARVQSWPVTWQRHVNAIFPTVHPISKATSGVVAITAQSLHASKGNILLFLMFSFLPIKQSTRQPRRQCISSSVLRSHTQLRLVAMKAGLTDLLGYAPCLLCYR